MAHIMSDRTKTATMWAVRFDGVPGEMKVTAHRMQEMAGAVVPTFGSGYAFTFFDEENRVVFQAPRERVLYVRRLPDAPAPDDGLTLRLPAHMAAEGGQQIARLNAGWNEVFPGLQCAIFLPTDDDGNVVAHFRLTPQDSDDPAAA